MESKEYILEGLCCGNCAAKIENEINALPEIEQASINFSSKTLTVFFSKEADISSIAGKIEKIAVSRDSDIVIFEKKQIMQGKKSMYLLGLCCTECAKKISGNVEKLQGVKSAQIDFAVQKLTIEVYDAKSLPAILRKAAEIAKSVDSDLQISYTAGITQTGKNPLEKKKYIKHAIIILGAVIYLSAIFLKTQANIKFLLFLISYILIGGEIVFKALKNISKGYIFDENFLMSAATIGAFLIGEYPEGVAVMLFYQIGEACQKLAVNRSRQSIASLMDIRSDFANLKIDGKIQRVPPEEVGIDDIILIKPGEKIPLDGVVVEGISVLDTSALTGEVKPVKAVPGNLVLSGSINKNGLLTVRVTKEFGESTVSKILELVQNASSRKAKTENFITRFAGYYTPFVTFSALALAVVPPLIIPDASFSDWIYRALAFLVVSCPCALVISVPLSFFGGIGGASREGILVKGSNYLEALSNIDTVVMDKTGTLTKGVFEVAKIQEANGFTKEDVLKYAAFAENYSNHPIASSIKKALGKTPDSVIITEQKEYEGYGVSAEVNGKHILAGNSKLMQQHNISYTPLKSEHGTVVYIAVDNTFIGSILISDTIKEDSKAAISKMRKLGVNNIAMLTGDTKEAGEKTAAELDIDNVYTELLPQDKVKKLEELIEAHGKKGFVAFVGDGVNDAPVLARADIGIAMGALGSDAAIEAADVVLMTDEPSKIASAIRIAKKTKAIVLENIIFAMTIKILVLILAAFGKATMWEAVFGDVGVTIIAVINSMRAMKVMHNLGV